MATHWLRRSDSNSPARIYERARPFAAAPNLAIGSMCNLYCVRKGQSAIRDLFSVKHDRTGNLPPLPAIFRPTRADRPNWRYGEPELAMARCGMPGPPEFGGQPVTNNRNSTSR